MSAEMNKHDRVLLALVMNLQGSAMVQLGKLADPTTGKTARSLDGARYAIDVLEMLQAKCRDRTHADVVALLDRTVMDLQLNYTDEAKKGPDEPPDAPDAPEPDAAAPLPDGDAPEEEA